MNSVMKSFGYLHSSPRLLRALVRIALLVVVIMGWSSVSALAATVIRTSTWTYDMATTGLLTSETVEPGNAALEVTTTYEFDIIFGLKTKATVSSGASGSAGFPARSSSTTYTDDGRFVSSASSALDHNETREHDLRFGGIIRQVDPNGLRTDWAYDDFGRKKLEERPDLTKTKWEYLWCSGVNGGTTSCPSVGAPGTHTAAARYVVVTTPLATNGTTVIGAVERIYFDQFEREIRRESQGYNNDSQTARAIYLDTVYNARGQVWKKTRPYFSGDTAVWTTYTYDAVGRPIIEDRPNGQVNVTYNGLVNTVKNEWGEVRITTKNSQGQVIHVKNGGNDGTADIFAVSTYTYDPFGNLMSVKDDEAGGGIAGNTTSFTYDGRGRKLTMNDPDKGAWSYVYDALGQLKKQTDAKGQVTEMTYDLLGRMTSRIIKKSPADGGAVEQTDNWTFDDPLVLLSKGKMTEAKASNSSGVIFYRRTHSFDAKGRPEDTYVTIDGGTAQRFRTQYDVEKGWVSSLQYPSGLQLSYHYTGLGELKHVRDIASLANYWTLSGKNASRQLTGEALGNGVTTTKSYDAGRGLITGIQTSNSSGTLQNWVIGYDSVGNVKTRDESISGVSDSLNYDPLNRLLSAQTVNLSISLNYTVSMTYSADGNLLSKSDVGSYTYPTRSTASVARPHAVTEITSSTYGNKTFNYDANGNMVDGNGRHYNWTAFDQPLSINNGSHTATFKYSAEHHRIRQTINAANATEYYTDTVTGARSERLVDGSNIPQRWIDYVVAGDGVALTISTTESTYNYASAAVTRTWQHRDHLGSTTLTTNAAGLEDRRMAYDAWGKRRNTDGSANPSGSLETSGVPNRGFTDHEHLEEFGLIHMNGRIYDPVVARFVSADPIIDDPYSVQAFNRYSYVGNNPLTYTDPTGYLKLGRIFRMAFAIALAVIIMQPQIGLAAAMGLSTTQGAILAGAVAGAISTGSIQGAVMGGISGGLFAGIGPLVEGLRLAGVAADIARIGFSGVVGGVMSVMQGGKFGSGFLAAGITATFAPGLEKIGNIAARTAVGAVIGGLASVAAGGKFENGAMTGAFQALFTGLAEKIQPELALGQEGERHPDVAKQRNDSLSKVARSVLVDEQQFALVGVSGTVAINAPADLIVGYQQELGGGGSDDVFRVAAGDGTPKTNQAQNKQFRDVVKVLGLTREQSQLLHREISGQNMNYREILETGRSMFGGRGGGLRGNMLLD